MWALAATGEELSVTPKEYTKEEELVAISVDAVNGGEGNKTVRLWASVHCQQVLVLVYLEVQLVLWEVICWEL